MTLSNLSKKLGLALFHQLTKEMLRFVVFWKNEFLFSVVAFFRIQGNDVPNRHETIRDNLFLHIFPPHTTQPCIHTPCPKFLTISFPIVSYKLSTMASTRILIFSQYKILSKIQFHGEWQGTHVTF